MWKTWRSNGRNMWRHCEFSRTSLPMSMTTFSPLPLSRMSFCSAAKFATRRASSSVV